jgi:ribosomal protein S14
MLLLAMLLLAHDAVAEDIVVQHLPGEVVLVQGQSLVLAAAPGLCAWTLESVARTGGAARPVLVGAPGEELLVGATVKDRLELAANAPGSATVELQRRCQRTGRRDQTVRETARLTVLSASEAAARGPARVGGTVDLGRDGALPRGVKARVAAIPGGQPVPADLDGPGVVVLGVARVDSAGAFALELPPGAHALVLEVEDRVVWEGAVLKQAGPLTSGIVLGPGQERTETLSLPAELLLSLRRW